MKNVINEPENWLYRYRDFTEKNINALENDRLYFSTPEYFNDPYDNMIYANTEQIIMNVAMCLDIGMDDYIEKINKKNMLIGASITAIWHGDKKEEFLKEFFGDIIEITESIKRKVRKNTKIICFSKVFDSMLMWSHYADNHKGFLLVYSKGDILKATRYGTDDVITERKVRLEPVEYVENKIDLTEEVECYARNKMPNIFEDVPINDEIPQTKLKKMVTQKALDWSYESEWRLIPRIISLEEESSLSYIEVIPKAIVLGTMREEKLKEKILKIAHNKKIPVYEMVLDVNSPKFKLEIDELYDGSN